MGSATSKREIELHKPPNQALERPLRYQSTSPIALASEFSSKPSQQHTTDDLKQNTSAQTAHSPGTKSLSTDHDTMNHAVARDDATAKLTSDQNSAIQHLSGGKEGQIQRQNTSICPQVRLPSTFNLFNTLENLRREDLMPVSAIPRTYQTDDTERDGNCMFAAFARAYGYKRCTHEEVRATAVEWVKCHKEDFVHHIPESRFFRRHTFHKYLKRMSKLGEWGDNIILEAMCRAYEAHVIVVKEEKRNEFIVNEVGTQAVPKWSVKSSFLLYLWDYHYENLVLPSQIQYMGN